MRFRFRLIHAAPALAASALALAAPSAHAQSCNSLDHLVVVAGSSAVQNFLGPIAGVLAQQTPAIHVVYLSQGSCIGVGYMGNSTPGTADASSKVTTFNNDGTVNTTPCALDPGGIPVDIGVADVFAKSCNETVDATVHDFHGPNQVMQFAVPVQSTATAISAEAAYMIYGFGAASGNQVTPWNDPTVIYQRSSASGTQSMLASAIGVPPATWLPTQTDLGTNGVGQALAATASSGKANAAIGILAKDYTNAHTDTIKPLAYQAYGQSCSYYPDSKLNSFDMANVRDGHYAVWGPLHLYAYAAADGKASNTDVETIVEALSGAKALPGVDLIQIEATHGVVPDCAMHVSRQGEVTKTEALASYQPPESCDCKFVKEATGTAPPECIACTETDAGNSCPAARPHCNFGFCEVQ